MFIERLRVKLVYGRERQRRRETESGIDRWGRETERKRKRGRTIKRVGGRGNRSLLVEGMARANGSSLMVLWCEFTPLTIFGGLRRVRSVLRVLICLSLC